MATSQTVVIVVKKLLASPLRNKPKPYAGQPYGDWLTALVDGIAEGLLEVRDDYLQAAVRQHLRVGKWFPTISELIELAESIEAAASEQERVKATLAHIDWYKVNVISKLPICGGCGEHTPSLTDCPFCADMETAVAYNELSDVERVQLYLMETDVEMVLV